MNEKKKQKLLLDAIQVRKGILTAVHSAASGHPGGSLSAADLLTYLYDEELRVDPRNPGWLERDRFVLSKGHASPVLYSTLALKGFFDQEELQTFRQFPSRLQGHPSLKTPGVDAVSGSLGQGFSVAAGMAAAAQIKNMNTRVFVLAGDGEMEEGQNWEAMLFASQYHLDNLCILVDINNLQIDWPTCEVMNTAPLAEKFMAFGADVMEIDGHDFDQIEMAFERFDSSAHPGRPEVILAHTIKGRGVSFMEGKKEWHGKAPDDHEYHLAMQELDAAQRRIEVQYE